MPLPHSPQGSNAVDQALQQARALHRASKDVSLVRAMPAVRRAHGAGNFSALSLSALFRQRHLLQRKHFLHTIAVEAGFARWEDFVTVLRTQPSQTVGQYGALAEVGYPNLWFSTHDEAISYAETHGGRVMFYGKQALVAPSKTNPVSSAQEAHHYA